jgi:hypothetical protein
VLEFTPDGMASRSDHDKGRVLLLNFVMSKALIPLLAAGPTSAAAKGGASSPAAANGSGGGGGGGGIRRVTSKVTGGGKSFDNFKMMATVLYWVTRAALTKRAAPPEGQEETAPAGSEAGSGGAPPDAAQAATTTTTTTTDGNSAGKGGDGLLDLELHDGDSSVMATLFDDRRFAHVLAELQRSGWLHTQALRLRQIAQHSWGGALKRRARSESAMSNNSAVP